MSLKASSSFLDKFLQASRLNLIFTRVILLLVLVICSFLKRIFSITFMLSWTIKAFRPSRPNESKKKMSVFGSISSILHQSVAPLLELSVLAMTNGFSFLFQKSSMHDWWICSCSLMEKHPQNCYYVLISYIFESFFNLKITDSFSHFLHATGEII